MRKLLLFQHASHHIKQSTISSFSKTIVLRSVRSSNLMLNSILLTESFKLIGIKLTTTIRSENLQLLTALLLSFHLELLKLSKHLMFVIYQGYPCHSSKFIYK
ncbi:hypothetical protein QL285_029670 [Trifolium repens]|nr:hypothetical protein QL285_029670 [Trifolium repens]